MRIASRYEFQAAVKMSENFVLQYRNLKTIASLY
jgi:hypothetical protein